MAASQYPELLATAAPEFRADKDLLMTLVKKKPWVLQYAAPELSTDKDFIMALVNINPLVLEYANYKLQEDPQIRASAGLPPLSPESL